VPSPPIIIALGLLLLAAALAIWLTLELRRFLRNTPALTSVSGIVAFRRVVARQMWGAVGLVFLVLAAFSVVAIGLWHELADWHELPLLTICFGLFVITGLWAKSVEAQARAIPTIDEEIRRQRDRVIQIWTTRPLPPW
jgi:hypothetical protein